MFNNIHRNAALFYQVLSSLWWLKPNPKYERISNFMPRLIIIAIITVLSFSQKSFAQDCNFTDQSDGLTCESSIYLCNSAIDGFSGTLPITNPAQQPPFLCNNTGSIENPIWYSFVACESELEIKIHISNCTVESSGFTGMQAAIYPVCGSDQSIACFDDGSTDEITLSSDQFIPGNLYYFIVDGYGGSVCDFSFEVVSGISSATYNLGVENTNEISGTTGPVCVFPDKIFTFEVPDCEITTSGSCGLPDLYENEWICYDWTISPDTYVFIGSENNPIMEVVFLEEGEYDISVERYIHPFLEACSSGSCPDPAPISIEINLVDTIFKKTFLCPGEFVDICGNLIGAPGVYSCLDEDECTLTIDTIDVGNGGEIENLGIIALCPSECFTLEGIEYCDRDNYVIQSTVDCSINYQFSIQDLSFNVTTQPFEKINCNNSSVQIIQDISTNYEGDIAFQYLDSNGSEISNSNSAEISEPGNYIFVVYSPVFGDNCSDTIFFEVEEDLEKPEFLLNAESLTCTDKQAEVAIETTDNLVSYEWEGPVPGSVVGVNVPVIQGTEPGLYNVTVTGINGCTQVNTIEVIADYPPVELEVNWDDLDCNIAQSTLSYLIDVAVDSVVWTGPDEFRESDQAPIITKEGTYVLNVFATSGCDYTEIFEVLGKYTEPEIFKTTAQEWACSTESVMLEIDYADTSDFNLNWFTNDGEIIGSNNSKSLEVGSVGMYFLETTNNITGCVALDTIEVITNDQVPSELNVSSTNPLCFDINDGVIEIENVVGGTEPFTYFVNGEVQNSMMLENLAPAEYEIEAVDANGCNITQKIEIVGPSEITAKIDGPTEGIYEEFVSFEALVDDTFDIAEVNWYNEAGEFLGSGEQLTFQLLKNEILTLEVIDENGCIVIRTAPILLDEDYDYYVPNIFTPNGDGVNDLFNISPQQLPGTIQEFAVFDRWGNNVYQISNIDNFDNSNWGWDGKDKGVLVKQGIYVYYAKVETLGVEKELKGTITLMR